MPFRRVERRSFHALLRYLLRFREQRLLKRPLREQALPLPSGGWSRYAASFQ
jgi:hypothetical protein